jgi:hypothetical protein
VTTLQENCSDIYADAKEINEDRIKKAEGSETEDDKQETEGKE